MFTQWQSKVHEQGEQVLELGRALSAQQFEQARKLQANALAQAETAGRFAIESAQIGLDTALAAQKAVLAAFVPRAAAQ